MIDTVSMFENSESEAHKLFSDMRTSIVKTLTIFEHFHYNKDVWDTILINMSNEHEKISGLNKSVAESECRIERLLGERKIDLDGLTDEYTFLIERHISMAYTQGLEDGAKLIHTLLAGNMTNHVLRIYGDKADDVFEIGLVKAAFENKN